MELPSAEKLRSDVQSLESQMADPVNARNAQELKRLTAEHTEKLKVLGLVERQDKLAKEGQEAAEMIESGGEDMRQMAEEELMRLKADHDKLDSEIEEMLVARDPRDARDVILEIRAGAGGEEASLFAAELFRAYARYSEEHGWKIDTVSTSTSPQGGYKEVVAEINGRGVFGVLKFERGVHRVQRVPETEKQGRIHTSTVTVAVMPQAEEVDVEIKADDLKIDTYRASGKGGQHVNKTSSAVRITHLPTNTVVAVQDERSQHKNKDKAMKILRSRILESQEEAKHKEEAAERKAQVGSGDRSEKIRTYNFPQDRITDHRIKESWSNIPGVLAGGLDPLFESLRTADKEIKLKALKG